MVRRFCRLELSCFGRAVFTRGIRSRVSGATGLLSGRHSDNSTGPRETSDSGVFAALCHHQRVVPITPLLPLPAPATVPSTGYVGSPFCPSETERPAW